MTQIDKTQPNEYQRAQNVIKFFFKMIFMKLGEADKAMDNFPEFKEKVQS